MKKLYLLMLVIFINCYVNAIPTNIIENIHVDQFGYFTSQQKIAVISSAQIGFYGTTFNPTTTSSQYQIRRWVDDVVMYTGTAVAWGNGATHNQSGDKVWWFDFTSFNVEGSYYVYDVGANKASYKFNIGVNVYKQLMAVAIKTYYYQRCGTAKTQAIAGLGYADVACHVANLQDVDCRLYNNNSIATSKNLSGGWHDAGDYNKYVAFTYSALVDLLLAYKEKPYVFTDDIGIPESGNGIPDLLDEIKIELDWLLKMQQANGSVLSVVGVANFASGSPASADVAQRYYGPATTNASLTLAAVAALAATQYNSIGNTNYANTLQNAAINAYNWAVANPNVEFYNSGIIAAGEQEDGATSYTVATKKTVANIFLYSLTNQNEYKNYVDANYQNIHLIQWGYAYPFETLAQDALLYYANLNGVSTTVKNSINNNYLNSINTNNNENLLSYTNNTDAYLAYIADRNYVDGNNNTKAHQGLMFSNCITYNLNPTVNNIYSNAAAGFLHYIHGVNPTGFSFLTNMGAYGAQKSVPEFYHSWFADGSTLWDRVGTSTYGPAPGFVVSGVNKNYKLDDCCNTNSCGTYNNLCNTAAVTPPLNQPIQKSYRDFNTSFPQNSWVVSENGIYYQASYIKLLSKYIEQTIVLPTNNVIFNANLQNNKSVKINWQLNDEQGVSHYVIQKSYDGIAFFDLQLQQKNGSKNYVLFDNNEIKNEQFYRLAMQQINGSITYSTIKKITLQNSTNIAISPNPAAETINVFYFNAAVTYNTTINITNALGQLLYTQNIILKKGANNIPISIKNLASGVYYLQLNSINLGRVASIFIKK